MERLTSEQLKGARKDPAAPRMRYGMLARLLFVSMDLLYGRAKTLAKFRWCWKESPRNAHQGLEERRLYRDHSCPCRS